MITINPELQSLIPPLTAAEYAQLEANILADGCHDALVVWQEELTLLDGHNRYEICERHGLQYEITALSLPDFVSAKAWMIANQLGRRNLSPEQVRYFRGEQYNLQKWQGKRTDLTSHHNEGKLHPTAHMLADYHKVGKATIERDGAYARNVDIIADAVGAEARQTILARDMKVTQQEVQKLATIAKANPTSAKHVIAAVKAAPTPKAAKAIVQDAARQVVGVVEREEHPGTHGRHRKASPSTVESLAVTEVMPPPPTLGDLFARARGSLEVLDAALRDWREHGEMVGLHPDNATYRAELERIQEVVTRVAGQLVPAPAVPEPSTPRAYGALTAQVKQAAKELGRFTNATLAKHLHRKLTDTFPVLKRLVERGELRKEGEEYVMEQTVGTSGA